MDKQENQPPNIISDSITFPNSTADKRVNKHLQNSVYNSVTEIFQLIPVIGGGRLVNSLPVNVPSCRVKTWKFCNQKPESVGIIKV